MSGDYAENLLGQAGERYRRKLTLCSLEKCPYMLPADAWSSATVGWPPVDFPKVFLYLIKTPGVHTMEAMANYKSLASYKLLQSGWVQTVHHHRPAPSTWIFKADVTPSFRVNEEPHHPWVAVSSDGTVITAHCDCKAGLGESCSHVGGLLYKIELIVRLGGTQQSCTDELCQWNHAEWKGVAPATLSKIQLYNTEAKEKLRSEAKPRRAPPRPLMPHEKERLILRLLGPSAGPKLPVGLSLLSSTAVNFIPKKPAPVRQQLPIPPRHLFQSTTSDSDALAALSPTPSQRTYLAEITKCQSTSLTWYSQRAGRITSTKVYDVLHTNPDNPAPSLIRTICSEQPATARSEAMRWGNDHEDQARDDFTLWITAGHTDASVKKAGLILHPIHPVLAASPDGLVLCSCCGSGILEIKCPFKYRGTSAEEYLTAPDGSMDSQGELRKDHRYYQQVQHQMSVTGTEHCFFVVWLHPSNFLVDFVRRDPTYETNTVPTLLTFWQQHVLPELKTRSLETAKNKPPAAPGSAIHCTCGQPDEAGPMVGCDSTSCPHEWYHWSCLGLKAKPRSKKWYCPTCCPKKQRKAKK